MKKIYQVPALAVLTSAVALPVATSLAVVNDEEVVDADVKSNLWGE